jgi:beta-mannan synthase
VSFWRKLYLLYSFFFVRKVVAHLVPFMLYCVVIPLSVLIPEVAIPAWGVVYIPTTITLLYAIRNPRYDACKKSLLISIGTFMPGII